MGIKKSIPRRGFIRSTAAALSLVYLPGIGRVNAKSFEMEGVGDYEGRLCYNENPLGPSPQALSAMQEAVSMTHRYPDWYSETLEAQIARHHGLNRSNICVGAGATEVIHLIADAFLSPGDEMITATPTYFQMASEATANGATAVRVPVDENYVIDLQMILESIGPKTKLISLVNPNNPLATIISKTDMEAFLLTIPYGIVVVVDEAYHHYVHSPNYESCIRFINEGLPVIVVRTFSKAYGLAGARIGYSVASPGYTGLISASQNFGTVSRPSQVAARAALDDTEHLNNTIALNDKTRELLETAFSDMGLNFITSETNFMMFDSGTDAGWVVAQLSSSGYQVRTGSSWGMPQHIRVSTGTIKEMMGFIEALKDILKLGVRDPKLIPEIFALNSVYPNPFNSQCNIRISTSGSEKVKLVIYDTIGRKVRSLVNSPLQPGVHDIIWDGRNASGKTVASGVYIINLLQGEFAASTRVTLIK